MHAPERERECLEDTHTYTHCASSDGLVDAGRTTAESGKITNTYTHSHWISGRAVPAERDTHATAGARRHSGWTQAQSDDGTQTMPLPCRCHCQCHARARRALMRVLQWRARQSLADQIPIQPCARAGKRIRRRRLLARRAGAGHRSGQLALSPGQPGIVVIELVVTAG